MASEKLREGFCSISLYEYGSPLIVYKTDEKGEPIINEDEILILKLGRIRYKEEDSKDNRAQLGLSGKVYEFLRAELLLGEYDKDKCRLSKENYEKLKSIVDKKIKKFSKNKGVNLETEVRTE